jgi:(E)-4-hydroxy-3-methylbut-2-enyl-diphosphate synthase
MLGLRDRGVELISCPSCGRCEIDLIAAARQVDQLVRTIPENLKVAVMGCVVNGPGEAREADVGIAGGRGQGLLFRRGQIIKKVPEDQLVDALKNEINEILKERDQFNTEGH